MLTHTLVAAMVGAAIACGSSGTPPPTTAANVSSDDADDVSAGLMEHHRYHHHGGVMLLIAMSVDTLGVDAEQKAAVEKIRSDLHARMEPARAAEQNLVAMLVTGLTGANVDPASVDAAVAKVGAAAEGIHDASTDAVNALHDVLTPVQREELVEKVNAHWAVWQKVNAEEGGKTNAEGHLATLAIDLGLTTEQVAKARVSVGDAMKGLPQFDPQEITAHLRAFGDAFRSEKFDAKLLTTASAATAHMAGWGAAHMAHFIEAVCPVLTPDQRTKLAALLQEHATHDPSRGNP